MNSSTTSAGAQALATQYNNLRKDLIVQAGQYAVSTGSANAYLLSIDAQYVAYTAGDRIVFKASFTNTGDCTINVNSLGIKNIIDIDGVSLCGSSIITGSIIECFYNGTSFVATAGLSIKNSFYYGDGSDGNVTISSNTTLTRDMYYNNLTVNTGINLDPAGYAIYVKGTTTLSGTAKVIRNGSTGGNASTSTGGNGGGALSTNTCGVCLGGANGGSGVSNSFSNGSNGVSVSLSYAGSSTIGANGGSGGIGGTAGGSGGTGGLTSQGPLYNKLYNAGNIMSYLSSPARGLTPYGALPSAGGGGSGGGVGGGAGGGGGGGGGNGGNIFIYSNIIAGTGTIEAIGGNGGSGGTAVSGGTGGGGGGAGGSGGIVYIVYKSGTPWTCTLTGGAGGSGGAGNGGNPGTSGSSGTVGQSILINT